jgi:hypothetical protein
MNMMMKNKSLRMKNMKTTMKTKKIIGPMQFKSGVADHSVVKEDFVADHVVVAWPEVHQGERIYLDRQEANLCLVEAEVALDQAEHVDAVQG